jgi:hypothetical protein
MTASTEGLWTAVGGIVDETRATLALQGAELDPSAVTARLGVAPTRCHRQDETRATGDWLLEVNVQAPEDADTALSKLFAMLPEDGVVWAELHSAYRVSLTLMMVVKAWNRGFRLSDALLAEVTRRGLSVNFEVYAEPQQMPSACFA